MSVGSRVYGSVRWASQSRGTRAHRDVQSFTYGIAQPPLVWAVLLAQGTGTACANPPRGAAQTCQGHGDLPGLWWSKRLLNHPVRIGEWIRTLLKTHPGVLFPRGASSSYLLLAQGE